MATKRRGQGEVKSTKAAKKATAKATKKSTKVKEGKKNPEKKDDEITLLAMDIRNAKIPVVGLTSLIVSNWSEKSLRMIRDAQQKKATQQKEPKNPRADFEAAKYRLSNGDDGVPSIAFKNAIVSAARFNDLKMTVLRGAIFINSIDGDLLPLEFESCEMREDPVRVGMGKTDLRYRPEYKNWRVVLPVTYNANVLSIEQVVNLIRLAGFSVGVCEWRPEKSGQFGRFDVAADEITESI